MVGFGSNLDSQGNIGSEQFNLNYYKNGGQIWFNQDFWIQVQPAQYDYWGQIWNRTISVWDNVGVFQSNNLWAEGTWQGYFTLSFPGCSLPPPPPDPPPTADEGISRETPQNMEVQEPVDVGTGYLLVNETLLAVRGAQPIPLTLSYNSGWCYWYNNYQMALFDFAGGDPARTIAVYWPGGRTNHFYPLAGSTKTYYSNEISALHDTLYRNADQTYGLILKDQTRYHFTLIKDTVNSPSSFPTARLDSIINAVGQTLTLTYANTDDVRIPIRVNDTASGASLTFAYTSSGDLGSVTDRLGRQVKFHLRQVARLQHPNWHTGHVANWRDR